MNASSFGVCTLLLAAASSLHPAAQAGPPNLEGIWEFTTITPLERPGEFADKPFLTREEAHAYKARRLQAMNLDGPRGADLNGPSVNEFWSERGDLAVIDGRFPASLVTDPPDGRIPDFTEGRRRHLAQRTARRGRKAGAEDFTASERCFRDARPPLFPSFDKGRIEIFQTGAYVAIRQENLHETRIVPLNRRPHLGKTIRSWVGDARGEWQATTLVVDSTNFVDLEDRFDENLHLIERFSRLDRDTLHYEFTVDDPTVYTRPWTVVLPMKRSRDRLYEDGCHEGNYALPHMLSALRFQDG